VSRPRPTPSPPTEAFWAATADSRFLLQRCRACGSAQFYPKATCTTCGSSDLDWEAASGRGTLHTYTVARRPTHPAFEGAEPYVVAIIELEEGPRVTSNLVDCAPEDVRVGMAVELVWDEQQADGIRLPLWQPA
jgi:uncharacterized OB-fold protein